MALMRRLSILALLIAPLACGPRGSSNQVTVDTTFVFSAPPSSSPARSVPGRSPYADTLSAAMEAYWARRIAADSAAKVVVRYMTSTGKNIDRILDPPLREAVARELKRRQGP
jgi:hypothetical protein